MSGLRPFGSPRRHRGYISLDASFLRPIRSRGQLDQRVKRDFHPRTPLLAGIQEVRIYASQDGLMRDDDDVLTALEFHDDRLKADDNVAVRLATAITIVVLVFVARLEILGVALRNVLVGETVAHAAVKLVKRFPFQLLPTRLRGQVTCRLRCAFQCRRPDYELGVGWDAGL